jgi:hypothetical protein
VAQRAMVVLPRLAEAWAMDRVRQHALPLQPESFALDAPSQRSLEHGQHCGLTAASDAWDRVFLGRRFLALVKPSIHTIAAIKVMCEWWSTGFASPTRPAMHPKVRSLEDLLWMVKSLNQGRATPDKGLSVTVIPPADLGALSSSSQKQPLQEVKVPLHQVVDDLDVHVWCSKAWGVDPASWNFWDTGNPLSSPRRPNSHSLLLRTASIASGHCLHASWDLEFIRGLLRFAGGSSQVFWRYKGRRSIPLPYCHEAPQALVAAVTALLPPCIRANYGELQSIGKEDQKHRVSRGSTFAPEDDVALSFSMARGLAGGMLGRGANTDGVPSGRAASLSDRSPRVISESALSDGRTEDSILPGQPSTTESDVSAPTPLQRREEGDGATQRRHPGKRPRSQSGGTILPGSTSVSEDTESTDVGALSPPLTAVSAADMSPPVPPPKRHHLQPREPVASTCEVERTAPLGDEIHTHARLDRAQRAAAGVDLSPEGTPPSKRAKAAVGEDGRPPAACMGLVDGSDAGEGDPRGGTLGPSGAQRPVADPDSLRALGGRAWRGSDETPLYASTEAFRPLVRTSVSEAQLPLIRCPLHSPLPVAPVVKPCPVESALTSLLQKALGEAASTEGACAWARGWAAPGWTLLTPPWQGTVPIVHPSFPSPSILTEWKTVSASGEWEAPSLWLVPQVYGDGYCLVRSLAPAVQLFTLANPHAPAQAPRLPPSLTSGRVTPLAALLSNLWALIHVVHAIGFDTFESCTCWPFPGKQKLRILAGLCADLTIQATFAASVSSDAEGEAVAGRAAQVLRTPSTYCGMGEVLIMAVALGIDIRWAFPVSCAVTEVKAPSVKAWMELLSENTGSPVAQFAGHAAALLASSECKHFVPRVALVNIDRVHATVGNSSLNHWVPLFPTGFQLLWGNREAPRVGARLSPEALSAAWAGARIAGLAHGARTEEEGRPPATGSRTQDLGPSELDSPSSPEASSSGEVPDPSSPLVGAGGAEEGSPLPHPPVALSTVPRVGYVALVRCTAGTQLALVISAAPIILQVFQLCGAKDGRRKHRFFPVDCQGAVTPARQCAGQQVVFARGREPWHINLTKEEGQLVSDYAPFPTTTILLDWKQSHRWRPGVLSAHLAFPESLAFPQRDPPRAEDGDPSPELVQSCLEANKATALRLSLAPPGVAGRGQTPPPQVVGVPSTDEAGPPSPPLRSSSLPLLPSSSPLGGGVFSTAAGQGRASTLVATSGPGNLRHSGACTPTRGAVSGNPASAPQEELLSLQQTLGQVQLSGAAAVRLAQEKVRGLERERDDAQRRAGEFRVELLQTRVRLRAEAEARADAFRAFTQEARAMRQALQQATQQVQALEEHNELLKQPPPIPDHQQAWQQKEVRLEAIIAQQAQALVEAGLQAQRMRAELLRRRDGASAAPTTRPAGHVPQPLRSLPVSGASGRRARTLGAGPGGLQTPAPAEGEPPPRAATTPLATSAPFSTIVPVASRTGPDHPVFIMINKILFQWRTSHLRRLDRRDPMLARTQLLQFRSFAVAFAADEIAALGGNDVLEEMLREWAGGGGEGELGTQYRHVSE